MNIIFENNWQIKSRHLLFFLFISLVISFILTGIIVPDFFGDDPSPLSEITFGYIFVITLGYLLFTLGKKSSINWSNLLGNFSREYISWQYIFIVIPLISITFASVYLIYYPLSFYYPEFVKSMIIDLDINFFWFSGSNYQLANVLSFGEVVLLAPVIEELFFRGFLFTSLASKYGIFKGIFISSFIFGLFHIDILGGLIFGVVLCVIYLKTKSLAPVILIHILNNFVSFAWSYIYEIVEDGERYNLSNFQNDLWMGILGFIIGVVWLIYFYRKEFKGKIFKLPYFTNSRV